MIEVKDIDANELVFPVVESPVVPPAEVMVTFSNVSVKADKTFVVTVAGNRCHVTQDYNAPLYQAVRATWMRVGSFQNMRKMLLSSQIRLYVPGVGLKRGCRTRRRSLLKTAMPATWAELNPLRMSSSRRC